jgi:hypothetical protein
MHRTDLVDALSTPSVNGTPDSPAKPPRKGRSKHTTSSKPLTDRGPSHASRSAAAARKAVVRLAHRITLGAVVASAGLNAWACILDSGTDSIVGQAAAAAGGGMVPIGVWALSKLAGHLLKAGWCKLACVAGAVGCFGLILSLTHCTHGIASITGAPRWFGAPVLAFLTAVLMDCGLVVSELSAVLVHTEEGQ